MTHGHDNRILQQGSLAGHDQQAVRPAVTTGLTALLLVAQYLRYAAKMAVMRFRIVSLEEKNVPPGRFTATWGQRKSQQQNTPAVRCQVVVTPSLNMDHAATTQTVSQHGPHSMTAGSVPRHKLYALE
jgi:hypothetical protein